MEKEVSQDMFPGAWIEPRWSLEEKRQYAPFYALRLALGGIVSHNPRGHANFVSLIFEGTEYVLHKDNYEISDRMRRIFIDAFLEPKGHAYDSRAVRYKPDVLLEGLRFLSDITDQELKIDPKLTRMIWMIPDVGPCGYYRSILPYRYMKRHHKENFYCESHNFLNLSTLKWFDIAIMHRYPPSALVGVFQNLKNSNKVLAYEYDDDIFNVPDWNVNAKAITQEVVDRGRQCLEMSDLVMASTQNLAEISEKDVAFECPNLIDMDDIGAPLPCDRVVSQKLYGYHAHEHAGKVEFKGPGKRLTESEVQAEYNPVRILWTGSNTHDHDLETTVQVVKQMIKKYGLSIRFFFFGYCPPEFLAANVSTGNSNFGYSVRMEYSNNITYTPPTSMNYYYNAIRKLEPDLAICPLADHVFNLSKSNLKILEMGAFGIPCVASDFGPYRFLRNYPQSGLLADDNVADWVEKVSLLVNSRDTRKAMGEEIYHVVKYYYSWNYASENRAKWDDAFFALKQMSDSRKF